VTDPLWVLITGCVPCTVVVANTLPDHIIPTTWYQVAAFTRTVGITNVLNVLSSIESNK